MHGKEHCHLLRVAADDPAVLVVLGQHARVADPQPQAGRLLPGGAEANRLGEPGVSQRVGEQGHATAVLHRPQIAGTSRDLAVLTVLIPWDGCPSACWSGAPLIAIAARDSRAASKARPPTPGSPGPEPLCLC
jgi:hypothetical protein